MILPAGSTPKWKPPFAKDRHLRATTIRLLLKNKDFTTAYRIAVEINKYFPKSARANHSGSVDVTIPQLIYRCQDGFCRDDQ